jgi:hypothetical protein
LLTGEVPDSLQGPCRMLRSMVPRSTALHKDGVVVKLFLRSLACLFALLSLMAAGLPYANTCRTVLVWNNTQQKWIRDCRGRCTATPCAQVQAGNPIGNTVPLACGCTDGGAVFSECAGRVYVNTSTGDVVLNPAPGCITPEELCSFGWHCHTQPPPTMDDTVTITWDPCKCAAP